MDIPCPVCGESFGNPDRLGEVACGSCLAELTIICGTCKRMPSGEQSTQDSASTSGDSELHCEYCDRMVGWLIVLERRKHEDPFENEDPRRNL